IEHRHLVGAETQDALVVALPDAGAIIVQDLVYNRGHLFLGERRFNSWRLALEQYRGLPYGIVLPGHGMPGGKSLYDEVIQYLDFTEDALGKSATASAFKKGILERYPDYGCGK